VLLYISYFNGDSRKEDFVENKTHYKTPFPSIKNQKRNIFMKAWI